ncbi:MAG TPA: MFS transporter [Deinococcales bacterium]|nr:MFS transporter [Deinococcales bacterium]
MEAIKDGADDLNTRPDRHALTQAETTRGLTAIAVVIFLMRFGFFMLVPLIAVHFSGELGWAAAGIGLGLALRELFHQGLTIIGGLLGDRYGLKLLIALGLLVRVAGFGIIALVSDLSGLIAALVLAGLAGALFDAPRAAAIATLTTPETRNRFFSAMNVASNIGILAGPLAAVPLIHVGFPAVALASAATYLVALAVILAFLPDVRGASAAPSPFASLAMVANHRTFLKVVLLLTGYWCVWAQLEFTLPLAVKERTGSGQAASLVLLAYGVTSVILQYPLVRVAERRMATRGMLVGGLTVMSAGLGAAALLDSTAGIYIGAALIGVGSVVALPAQQTVIANLADRRALGSFFGVSSLGLAVGGALGSWGGGILYGVRVSGGTMNAAWAVFAILGLLSAAALHRVLARGA